MSAKLTVIFFILICFEIGALLLILPWLSFPSWGDNYLLVMAAERLDWQWLVPLARSGYIRGAVSGIGAVNILLGVWEIRNFRKTVQNFQVEWSGEKNQAKVFGAAGVSDNRSPDPSPQER